MGLFGPKTVCVICEEGVGKIKIANKECICSECFKKSGLSPIAPVKTMTVADINAAMDAKKLNDEEISSFNTTKKIGAFIEIDDDRMKWLVPDGFFGKKKNPKIYNFSDIIDYELLEDGESITKGGLGRAVAGGVLLGGLGAVVGGVTGGKKTKGICNSLRIKITVNDINNPVVYMDFIKTATKKDSFVYKSIYNSAQECLSVLQLMCSSEEVVQGNNSVSTTSDADEILKFKNLLDSGIITQEEFDAKKKQLLGL